MKTEEQLINECVARLSSVKNLSKEQIQVIVGGMVKEIKSSFHEEINYHSRMAAKFAKELKYKATLEEIF